jgi:hypothetical protein
MSEEMNNQVEQVATESVAKAVANEEIIKDHEKWFDFFVKLPKILTIVTAVLMFVWSIVDPSVFYYDGGWGESSSYGVMQCQTFFGAMIIWWIIGAIDCALTYAITKLCVSYSVLHIYYLKDIRREIMNKK